MQSEAIASISVNIATDGTIFGHLNRATIAARPAAAVNFIEKRSAASLLAGQASTYAPFNTVPVHLTDVPAAPGHFTISAFSIILTPSRDIPFPFTVIVCAAYLTSSLFIGL